MQFLKARYLVNVIPLHAVVLLSWYGGYIRTIYMADKPFEAPYHAYCDF